MTLKFKVCKLVVILPGYPDYGFFKVILLFLSYNYCNLLCQRYQTDSFQFNENLVMYVRFAYRFDLADLFVQKTQEMK